MRRITCISCIICFGVFLCNAAEPKYPVSEIPEELKKDAYAVIREDKKVYTIVNKEKGRLDCHLVITILSKSAEDLATEVLGYNKLTKIIDFNAYVYDARGSLTKKLRNKEILDQSAFDGFSLFSDYRLKYADLSQVAFPYTVEFEYSIEYNYLYSITENRVLPQERVSVQKNIYQIIFPSDLSPRFKALNLDIRPRHTRLSNQLESYEWIIENVKAIRAEPSGPSFTEIAPRIISAPGKFEYAGYEGNMSTWSDYGKWQLSLNKDRDILPEETKLRVNQLTNKLNSMEEKTKVLYEYMQNRTRYVNITLGIGGLQPFEADVVDKVGYGDCKALSNYMIALLKVAGIKAFYTKVMAGFGAPEIYADFPSHQTNHIIVAVPTDRDTIWLECTSQTTPFGYLGTFTGDRSALMITEDGGKLVNTTSYSTDDNFQSRYGEVYLGLTGDAEARIKTTYSGLQYENGGLDHILTSQFDDQKKWVQANTQIPSFDVRSFSMENKKAKIPVAVVNLDLALRKLATASGKRIFLTPNLMNRSTYVPEKVESRKTNVHRRMTYTDVDTIRYHLPEGIYPEFLPEAVKMKNQFGEYEATFTVDQGSLVYVRKVRMNKGVFPPESYNELIDFYRAMNRADNTKLVFLSKT